MTMMNELKLFEYPNLEVCRKLINCEEIWKNDKKKLLIYILEALKYGKVEVKYKCDDYGRLFNNKYACCNMWNKVRSTLFADTEIDIDIINAHYNIFLNLCKKYNIESPLVKKYCLERDVIIKSSKVNQEWLDKFNERLKKNEDKKGVIKMLFTCLLFGGGENTFINHYNINRKDYDIAFNIKELHDELTRNTKKILIQDDFKQLIRAVRKKKREQAKLKFGDKYDEEDFNVKNGSLLSYILQEQEKIIVRNAIDIFKKQGVIVTSYIYDGFMVKKDGVSKEKLDELLDLISEDNIVFIQKPFKEELDLNEVEERFDKEFFRSLGILKENEKIHINSTYDIQKAYFELYHFKLQNPIGYSRISSDGVIFIKYKDIIPCYNNYYGMEFIADKKGEMEWKRFTFISKWLQDDTIPQYDRMDMYPNNSKCPKHVYNLWRPFSIASYKPKTKGNIQRILNHFMNVANNKKDIYEYLLNWYAHIIQNPFRKTDVMIILYGVEGTGKSCLGEELMRKIIGEDKVYVNSKVDAIFGRFSNLEGKLFVVFNEGESKDTFKYFNTIKDHITRKTTQLEKKGIMPYKITSLENYMMTTNQLTSMPITQTDRRFMASKTNPAIANDKEYFDNLYDDFDNKDVIKAFYDFMMSRDISNFNPIKDRPQTDLFTEMQRASLTSTDLFLINLEKELDAIFEETYSSKELFDVYKLYCSKNNYENTKKQQSFIASLNMDYSFVDCVRIQGKRKYKVDEELYNAWRSKMEHLIEE